LEARVIESLRITLGEDVRLVEERELKRRVRRVHLATADGLRTLVVKLHEPRSARRNLLARRAWLPAVGLEHVAPAVIATGRDAATGWTWQAYEDLGDATLDDVPGEDPRALAAVDLLADLHGRFLAHPLLDECRTYGDDLGIAFFARSVREAAAWVARVRRTRPTGAQAELCDRLHDRLARLHHDLPRHTETLERFAGPVTFLHGDLWKSNIVVTAGRTRLIDWDCAGAGPLAYDLSTFVTKFAPSEQPALLARYRRAIGEFGVRLPPDDELRLAFATAELGRLATCVSMPAMSVVETQAAWGWDALAARDAWLADAEAVAA
jgi:Ser/Thr protein kinase RdoA (MazF antagonist)